MFSLFHIALLLLIPTLVLRMWILYAGLRKFVKIFEGTKNAIEGKKLMDNLEIPGLRSFVKQEIILGIVPYIVLGTLMIHNQYTALEFSSLNLVLALFTVIVFLAWFAFDVIKSIMIYRELSKLADDTTRLKKITGSALDGLRFVIHSKGIIRRTAMKYTAGIIKSRLEKQQAKKKSFFRKVGISGLNAIEKVTSFPEKVSKKLAEWVKEDLDERLMKRFQKYSSRKKSVIIFGVLWSLLPSLWVIFLYYVA